MTLATRPAHELAPLIRQKQVSPVELMRDVLDRIGRLEPQLNAMAFLDPEVAMAGARDAEAALMRSARSAAYMVCRSRSRISPTLPACRPALAPARVQPPWPRPTRLS